MQEIAAALGLKEIHCLILKTLSRDSRGSTLREIHRDTRLPRTELEFAIADLLRHGLVVRNDALHSLYPFIPPCSNLRKLARDNDLFGEE